MRIMSQGHSPTGDSSSSASVFSTTGLSPPRTNDPIRSISMTKTNTNGLHYSHDRRPSICSQHSSYSMKFDKTTYESAPVARNTAENNQVRIIDYRGTKITSFNVDGRELICLPQAFDLFLKNLVGGLHTVYTKLKRLEIIPVVCNVEQVRILRGLGAIQPGVNRCKLLAPTEFDILYDDCTNSGSRPGRPPKRNANHPLDDCSDEKRIKLSSSLLLRSFPDFANQALKYPVQYNHPNGNYLSLSSPCFPANSTANGSSSSSFAHSFGYSAFAPTLPLHFGHNHAHHHSPNPYLLDTTKSKSSSTTTTTTTTLPPHRPVPVSESRLFTIDAMLGGNGKNLNKENSQQRDRLTKPIDLSSAATTTTTTTSTASDLSPLATAEHTSTVLSTPQAAAALNFLHMKNIVEMTVESARLREKQLENEIGDLRNELRKEQDCRQKLEQDILELRRIRSVLVKRLKRFNRSSSSTSGGCSNSNGDTKNETPRTSKIIEAEST